MPFSRFLVLVADADDDTRKLYRAILPVSLYEVREAIDGREALTSALTEPLSLLIMELALPLVSGFALCEILRRDPATALCGSWS
jgi:CheY-like chemotaxis protein